MDKLGQRLQAVLPDRYTVERELGRGGMATVFLAQDLKQHRPVAIKVLRPEIANAIGIERFLLEIEIAAQLTHPHILPLFESGRGDGLVYYVMPYVEGESLRDRIDRERQLPLDDAIRIAKQVASALAHAHSHGIVHRDIKPGNIMLVGGEAVVADFGIARAITSAGGAHLTETGIALGTPAYMSPEQAGGEESIDGRSDIYSLGCVLYEMLGGEPPFTGPSSQAVIARQLGEEPRSLRIVRPKIPPAIEVIVQTALEKVPADRFSTAGDFVEALEHPESIEVPSPQERRRWGRWLVGLAGAAAVTLLAFGIRGFGSTDAAATDRNRVMVFPLVERGQIEAGTGVDAAIMIGNALEHTDPLRWLDGWNWLNEAQRENATLVSTETHRNLSLHQRAGFYISGFIVGTEDSATVTLQLHDAAGDTVVARESASGLSDRASILTLGVRVTVRFLPKLIEPLRGIDPAGLAVLTTAAPAAIAHWIQGEREYRTSHFAAALDFYRRAVEQDSLLAIAAVKGAQAASWKARYEEAEQLIAIALKEDSLLPTRYRQFALGLNAYLAGNADTAVSRLRLTIEADPDWSEAWMALGEVYYHLLPSEAPLDSLAEAAFLTASMTDTTFSPPLVHLTEIAIRDGNVRRADSLIGRLTFDTSDSTLFQQLQLMLACVRDGTSEIDWAEAVSRNVDAVIQAARALSAAAAQPDCAIAGFRAALAIEGVASGRRWGALQGLQGTLLAQQRTEDALSVLLAGLESGIRGAYSLYVFDAVVGFPFDSQAAEAERIAREGAGEFYEKAQPETRWLLGVWHASRGNIKQADAILRSLDSLAADDGDERHQLLTRSLAAHVLLAKGDTNEALAYLRDLRPTGPARNLSWSLLDPLPIEQATLATILLAQGDFHGAYRASTIFDHQQPVMYLPYLPTSLAIRLQAAEAMGRPRLAELYRSRIERLAHRQKVVGS